MVYRPAPGTLFHGPRMLVFLAAAFAILAVFGIARGGVEHRIDCAQGRARCVGMLLFDPPGLGGVGDTPILWDRSPRTARSLPDSYLRVETARPVPRWEGPDLSVIETGPHPWRLIGEGPRGFTVRVVHPDPATGREKVVDLAAPPPG